MRLTKEKRQEILTKVKKLKLNASEDTVFIDFVDHSNLYTIKITLDYSILTSPSKLIWYIYAYKYISETNSYIEFDIPFEIDICQKDSLIWICKYIVNNYFSKHEKDYLFIACE